jgi:hypothetical protein
MIGSVFSNSNTPRDWDFHDEHHHRKRRDPMISIKSAKWRVSLVETITGNWWWTATATANLGLYVNDLDGSASLGCTKEEAAEKWIKFAKKNGIKKWKFR